jgi:hypothetical protein
MSVQHLYVVVLRSARRNLRLRPLFLSPYVPYWYSTCTSPHCGVGPILEAFALESGLDHFTSLHFRFLTFNPSVEQYLIKEEIYLITSGLLRSIELLCLACFLTSLCFESRAQLTHLVLHLNSRGLYHFSLIYLSISCSSLQSMRACSASLSLCSSGSSFPT